MTIALQELAEGCIVLKPIEETDEKDSEQSEERSYLERRGDIEEIMGRDEKEEES